MKKLNKSILNSKWIIEVTTEIGKYSEMNRHQDTAEQNLWYAYKSRLQGIFRAVNTHIKKEGIFHINYITSSHYGKVRSK